MIELRWLERQVPRQREIYDGFYLPPLPYYITERVLQYRETTSGHISEIWGAWQDVPVVKEE